MEKLAANQSPKIEIKKMKEQHKEGRTCLVHGFIYQLIHIDERKVLSLHQKIEQTHPKIGVSGFHNFTRS